MKSVEEVAFELKLMRFLKYAKSSGADKTWNKKNGQNYTLFIPTDEAFDSESFKRILGPYF